METKVISQDLTPVVPKTEEAEEAEKSEVKTAEKLKIEEVGKLVVEEVLSELKIV